MATKMEKLMEEMKADTAPETTPETTTTPAPEETTPPAPEETTPPAPEDTTPPANPDVKDDTPPAPEKKPSEFTPQERAEHAFKRQLAKQKEKHEAELKELKRTFQQQIDELKKQNAPKEEVKTREDFATDDEYIDYLVQRRYNAEKAKTDAARAEEDKKRAEQEEEQRKQQAELAERQQAWMDNVNNAFSGDENRRTAFLERVKYCMSKGLGEILDNCPVASDYIMNNPRGPVVLEKMLNDKATFCRVFNERNLNPMDIYYELREVDKELLTQSAAPANPAPAPANPAPVVPHLGRPGKQAGSGTAPDIFSDPRAMKEFLRTH